jgi:hypothetical protein
VQTKIDEAKTLLAPYMFALTPVERRELPKMGKQNYLSSFFLFTNWPDYDTADPEITPWKYNYRKFNLTLII